MKNLLGGGLVLVMCSASIGCASETSGADDAVDLQEDESPDLAVSFYNCTVTPQTPQYISGSGVRGVASYSCTAKTGYYRQFSVGLKASGASGYVYVSERQGSCYSPSASASSNAYSYYNTGSQCTWNTFIQVGAYDTPRFTTCTASDPGGAPFHSAIYESTYSINH